MRNIWIINQVAGHPESGWGERHYYLSKKWLNDGYDVKIISGSYNHMFNNFPQTKGQFTLEDYEGTTFCWIKCPKYDPKSIFRFVGMIIFALKAFFLPAKRLGRPDVILVSSMPIFSILPGIYLKWKYGAKLIFEVRDLWPLTPMYLMGYKKWHPMILFIGWLEKMGYRKANHIVSLLPNSEEYINNISGDATKFNWIPNGIDENLMENEIIEEAYSNLIPKDRFVIGYTGTMGMANALEYLIGASIQLKDDSNFFFCLVGDGYLKEELQNRVKGNNNIVFIPKIKKNQVQNMISYFDVCFIGRNNTPLFDHGVSSNKYFDYMLAKKPVLVSSNKIKDPVELSGAGIIVEPESEDAIVKGLIELYGMSDEEYRNMGEKGYEYVKKHHNFDFLSDKYSKLFK